MKFRTEIWKINDLVDLYKQGNLDLNPPYQRNFVWSLKDQQDLIDSIKQNYPLPSFFLFEKRKKYEMVDGQQRARTIIAFYDRRYPDEQGSLFDKKHGDSFLNYKITIGIIEKLEAGESIEEFYARVNKTGLKLNKPELRKAEYFDTNFLELATKLAADDKFKSLELFSSTTIKRMNDIELVTEIITQLKEGITDKKDKVDEVYEEDIDSSEANVLEERFNKVVHHLVRFNQFQPLTKTRYKQRNDFYTLFGFVDKNINLQEPTLDYFYKLLVRIGPDIKPSQDKCVPLKEYAINCVTQSNSKSAREARYKFFIEFLKNESARPNRTQKEIIKYYDLQDRDTIRLEKRYLTIDYSKLQ